jgi:hypothetical protein
VVQKLGNQNLGRVERCLSAPPVYTHKKTAPPRVIMSHGGVRHNDAGCVRDFTFRNARCVRASRTSCAYRTRVRRVQCARTLRRVRVRRVRTRHRMRVSRVRVRRRMRVQRVCVRCRVRRVCRMCHHVSCHVVSCVAHVCVRVCARVRMLCACAS